MDEQQFVDLTAEAMRLAHVIRTAAATHTLSAAHDTIALHGRNIDRIGGFTAMTLAYRIIGAMWAAGFLGSTDDEYGFSPRVLDIYWDGIGDWRG